MAVELTGLPDAPPVDPAVSRAAYRIVQEALTNAGKHAPARASASPWSGPPVSSSSGWSTGRRRGRRRRPAAASGSWGWLSGCAPSAAG